MGAPRFRARLGLHDQRRTFRYGDFINALITFVSIAAAV